MRKIAPWLIIFCLLASVPDSLKAQIQEVRLSTWFGFREIQCERFAPGEQLDFVDYLEANSEYPEDEYLGFSLFMNFNNSWQTDLRLTLNSGWGVSGYKLRLTYLPLPFAGFSIGLFQHPHYIYYFEEYLNNRDSDFYTDVRNGSNHKYRVAADRGWMAGLAFPLDYRFLHLNLQIQGGLSSIKPFVEEFGQKRIHSNYRRDLVFETEESYNWFFFPEATFFMDLLHIGNVRIGLQGQASWYLTKKYLSYQLTTYEWTYDSPETIAVRSPNHLLRKLEYDVGLVFRFSK